MAHGVNINKRKIQGIQKMEDKDILLEDTSGATAPNIAPTDEDLSLDNLFQQSSLPSLGRQIFSVIPMHGPTAGLFNIKKKSGSDAYELVRNDVEVYPSESIHTSVTQESIQDMYNQYGKEAYVVVAKLFRSLANDQENEKTIAFLQAQCKDVADLNLSNSANAELNLFEITQKVQELVLTINSKNLRSYEAFAVVPTTALGGVMALSKYAGSDDKDERGLFITKINQTKYYLNPDPTDTKCYVGIKDSLNASKSSAVFSPYMSTLVYSIDPDTGEMGYHIYNRFAITESPLHETDNEMLYMFDVIA